MNNEHILDESDFLVSQTDQKGIITFANHDFCKVSGYDLHELIGEPHSILRHPDMPKTAFKELWETVTSGKVWSGYVKNRTKDKKFYWVYAMVYPTHMNGELSYISCRRKPNPEEIKTATELYKTLS